jgi:hypothetical protein
MILPQITTFAPGVPAEYALEAARVRAPVAANLERYMKQNPQHVLMGGSLTRAALAAGWTPAAPVTLGSNLKFRPVPASSIGSLVRGQETASALPAVPDAIAKASQVAGLLEACRGPMEEFAKTHTSLDTPLDVLGLITATPQVWNAMIQPGAKNRTELFLAGAQAAVWAAKVAADFIPGMHSAKPALTWTGVVLKAGEQVHAVIVKPSQGQRVEGRRPGSSSQLQKS